MKRSGGYSEVAEGAARRGPRVISPARGAMRAGSDRGSTRDLREPFDFLTWFEFAPENAQAFDDLPGTPRSREEWRFVDREVEIRLAR